jgi:hypothetical protein
MLLKDERFVDSTRGNITMYNAEWSEEDKQYIYIQGDYVIRYEADDILSEDVSIALNEEGGVVETTYQDLMSGEETKEHKLLGDKELSEMVRHIHSITPAEEWELWENKISDPYDWDFIRFIIKHRPDLMI